MEAAPECVVSVGKLAAAPLPELPVPVVAAAPAPGDGADPVDGSDVNCADVNWANVDCTDADCTDADWTDADCADAENCADLETSVDRRFEGVSFDCGAEVFSTVCAGVGIPNLTGPAGTRIGASMAGAIACAATADACAAFSPFAVEVAEPARFRFAAPARSLRVASALPVDGFGALVFSLAFAVKRPASGTACLWPVPSGSGTICFAAAPFDESSALAIAADCKVCPGFAAGLVTVSRIVPGIVSSIAPGIAPRIASAASASLASWLSTPLVPRGTARQAFS
jgi:hypothetical protein